MTARVDERGFTLVELVMAVVISAIIFPVLTGAVLVGLRTLDNTNTRLAGSNDTLLVASYFTSDVEGASNMATGGTRAHVTPAVALPSGTTSTVLVMAYAMRGVTTVIAPPTGGTVWNTSAGAITSSVADELLTINADNQNNTLARVATTANPTSSLTHTIALVPTGAVTRRGQSSASVANGASLVVAKPSGVLQNDVLVAHITAATTAANVTPPSGSGWVEKSRAELAGNLASLIYVKTAGLTEPSSWAWGFGSGTHDIAGGIVAYTNVSPTSPVAGVGNTANPCGGETPVLSITTSDPLAVSSVGYFFQSTGGENQLVRKACNDAGTQTTQVLARTLQATAAATASCNPASCDPVPASVSLVLREVPLQHETIGRSYVLSARSRTG